MKALTVPFSCVFVQPTEALLAAASTTSASSSSASHSSSAFITHGRFLGSAIRQGTPKVECARRMRVWANVPRDRGASSFPQLARAAVSHTMFPPSHRSLVCAKFRKDRGPPRCISNTYAGMTSHNFYLPQAAVETAAIADSRIIVFSTTSVQCGTSSLRYFPAPVFFSEERGRGSWSRKESRGRGDDVVTPEVHHDASFALRVCLLHWRCSSCNTA
ncbi:hypothetical protein BJY52DRAFT_297348 [Lactarius psammicola]|nr:hypothetical protein BJY52DRAFT_297348 [Lactarius psammicola]